MSRKAGLGSLPLIGVLIAGCGGGSGSSGEKTTAAQARTSKASAAVSLSLSAASSEVAPDTRLGLSWSSSNADSCAASGGWVGIRSPSGSEIVGPLTQSTVFTLSCSGTGGSVSKQVSVAVAEPSLSFRASPEYVEAGGFSTLSWDAGSALGCTASGGWQGDQPVAGVQRVGPIDVDTSFELRCIDNAGSENVLVSVGVVSRVLRWRPPTQNVDGSPLTDLAAYTVYWGLSSSDYTDRHRIDAPAATEWTVVMAPGSYYIAMTAEDSEGNESAFSNEVLKIVP